MSDNIEYYSQYEQDKWFIENIFNYGKNGYFIDCGCAHYQNISNTLTLEKYFDWKGVGIDLRQDCVDLFNKNRKNISICASLSDKVGEKVEIINGGDVSGICDQHSNQFIKQNKENGALGWNTTTTTLTKVLNDIDAPKQIDFFSLDVEGHEISVLKGIDFTQYTIVTFCVERSTVADNQELLDFMVGQGYIHLTDILIDRVFVHPHYKQLLATSLTRDI